MNYSEHSFAEVLQGLIDKAVARAVYEATHHAAVYRGTSAESALYGDGTYVNDDWQEFALFDEDAGFDSEDRGFAP